MLFTYRKNSKEIALYKETDLKSHKILERQDLEKWVENYAEILGEELLILTTEYDKFDKTDERLDLLALDKTGTLVIIELKRDDSGKTVDLQAIKYAAYCSTLTLNMVSGLFQAYLEKKGKPCSEDEAKNRIIEFIESSDFEELNDRPRIILVSRNYRAEVTTAVLWLRKFGVDITCVKITPYEIDKDTIAFESNTLIPLPEARDFIIQTEKKEDIEHNLSLTQQEYIKFYHDIINRFKLKTPLNLSDPAPRSYYQIPTGIGGVHFEWAFHGRPRNSFRIELHFEKSDKKYNIEKLVHLEKLKSEIETKTGETATYQQNWGKLWSRLYIERNEGDMSDELKEWAVEKMFILYKLLQLELDKLRIEHD